MSFLATVMMMFCVNIIKTTGDCPRVCECKWKSGKESVLCRFTNLTEIPKYLDSGTQLLDLTGNNINKIGKDEFYNATLLNLQKIFMPSCRLKSIDRYSFRSIINLVELDLSNNELKEIPSHTFEFITELRELKLNGNPITKVLNNSFKTVPHLTKLDLSHCKIAFVEVKAFHGLENSLEWLKLDNNKISNIRSQALRQLVNLHGLELSKNPWNCTCGLRPLREWIMQNKVPYNIPPTCKNPSRLSNKDWDKLDLDEFACVPKIEAINPEIVGEEGNNITMSCIVNSGMPSASGITDPIVRWLRKDHVIANFSGIAGGIGKKLFIIQFKNLQTNLTIVSADTQDNGLYVCKAENKAGKSESSINLSVTVKPVEKVWSSRVIIASAAVIVLFILATVLLVICACSLRKRHRFHHAGVAQGRTDSYEMNHKATNNSYDKVIKYGNNYSASVKTDLSAIQGHQNKSRNGKYRGVPDSDLTEDESGYENGCATLTPISAERESRIWNSLRLSDGDDQLSESSERRLSPDLHIPRINRNEVLRPMNPQKGTYDPIDSLGGDTLRGYKSNPSELLTSTPGVKSHIMHKQILGGNGGTLYSSVVPESEKMYQESASKYPDLLELSLNDRNAINSNSYCTLPRKRSYKAKRPRHSSCGSESQSPLLPGSSGDSCDSNYSINRRLSMESSVPTKNTSLPTSPRNITPTTILSLLDNSTDLYKNLSPNIFEYKSSELEKFLKEYRNLQEQLYKMKESCENLKEDNLKFNANAERSRSVENSTISRLIDPVYSVNEVYNTTEIEPLYSVTQQLLNDTNNLDSVYSGNKLLLEPEDNNNPKSILKNKTCDQKTVLSNIDFKSESYWMSRNKLLNSFTDPNRGNDFYES